MLFLQMCHLTLATATHVRTVAPAANSGTQAPIICAPVCLDTVEKTASKVGRNSTNTNVYPDSKVHGAHVGPTGPRWVPCWPHELAIWVADDAIEIRAWIKYKQECLAKDVVEKNAIIARHTAYTILHELILNHDWWFVFPIWCW